MPRRRQSRSRSAHDSVDSRSPSASAISSALRTRAYSETFGRWHEWALRQRDFVIDGEPGITAEEYQTVMRKFNVLPRSPALPASRPESNGGGRRA